VFRISKSQALQSEMLVQINYVGPMKTYLDASTSYMTQGETLSKQNGKKHNDRMDEVASDSNFLLHLFVQIFKMFLY
jgi:hypothetical protein